MRKFILSSQIAKETSKSLNFQWSPFPNEITGISVSVPSPSGSKLLVVRNPEKDSPCKFEIWGPAQVEKVYTDGWEFLGTIAEEPSPSMPTFKFQEYKKDSSNDKEFGNWKGQGEWEEEWGETCVGKRQPALFVINVNSGETPTVKGIEKRLVLSKLFGLHQ